MRAMPESPLLRVLVADESLPNRRLIRELLTAFCACEVDDAASGEHACERITQREYALFVVALTLPDISGALLDRMIARVYSRCHPETLTAPSVIFLIRPDQTAEFQAVKRDARVRGAVPLPLSLDVLMQVAGPLLPAKGPPL
jgi:CheY-like chemotaxis protein